MRKLMNILLLLTITIIVKAQTFSVSPEYQDVCTGVTPASITVNCSGNCSSIYVDWYLNGEYYRTGKTIYPGSSTIVKTDTYHAYVKDVSTGNIVWYKTAIVHYGTNDFNYNLNTTDFCYGELYNITITSSNFNTNYTWYKSTDGLNYVQIDYTTNKIKTINFMDPPKVYYKIKETGNCGIKEKGFIATVRYQLTATEINGKNYVVGNESVGNLSTNISGGKNENGYQIKWLESNNGINYTEIVGQTEQNITIGSIPNTKWYKINVNDECGSLEKSKNVIRYESLNAGVIGDAQTICYNTAPTQLKFNTNPSGGSGTYYYQWQVSDDGTNFSDITGATNSTYQPGNLTSNKWYRVKVNDGIQGNVITNKIKITVNSQLNEGIIGESQNICYNTAPNAFGFIVGPSGGSGTYYYQWQVSDDGTNFSDITGATNSTYQPGNLTSNKWYRVKVESCYEQKFTNIIKITVAQPLSLPEINSNKTICYNTSPGTLYLEGNPTGGMGGYSYQWEYSDNGINFNTIINATNTQYEVGNLTSNKWYRVRVTNACEVKNTNAVKITVYGALNAGVIGDEQTICYNTAPAQLKFNTNPSGGDGIYTYQWQVSDDGTNYSNVTGATGTTYKPGNLISAKWYKVIVSNSCGSVNTSNVKITVANDVNAGIIGDEQNICNGTQPVTIGIKTSPTGGIGTYSYQWEVSNDEGIYSNITGANGNTYQPPALTTSKWYRLSVANQCKTVKTNVVKVTVASTLTVPIIGNEQSICYNTIPETLNASGTPQGGLGGYTYKWEVSNDNVVFNEIVGANENSYNPGPLTANRWYRMKVENICETKSTNSVKINVYSDVLFGTIGNNQSICNGSTPQGLEFNTNPSGGDGSFVYQWQVSGDGTNYSDIYGATGTTYQPTNMTTSKWYRVKVNSTCKSGYTGSVKVSVYEPLGEALIGEHETICYGQIPQEVKVTNNITGGQGNYAYQWERKVGYGNWEIISGATTSKYQPQALVSNTRYRVKVNDMCGMVTSNEVEKRVRDELNPGIIGNEQTICYNTAPAKLKFENGTSGGSGVYGYQWMESENGSVFYNVEQAIFQDYQPSQLNKTKYYKVKVTDNGGCGTKETNVIAVTVLPEVKPGTVGSSQVICYDRIPAILSSVTPATGGNGVFEYQWQRVVNGEWINISGANGENYQPESLKKTETYRRTANSYGCGIVISNSVVINVRDKLNPGAIGNNQTIPYGTQPQMLTTTLNANGGSGMFTYQWQVSENKETWANIANATNEYYQPGTLVKTTNYRRMVKDNECGEENTNVVEITVLNALNAGTIGENQLICNGSQPNKLVGTEATGGTGTYTYSWLKSTDDNTYALIPGADGRDYQPGPLTQTTYFKRRVENNGDKKESNKVAIEVRAALVEPNLNIKEKYCKNEVVNLLVQNVQNTYQYRWYNENMGEVGLGTLYVLGEISSDRTIYIDATDQNGCMSTRKKVDLLVDKVKAEFNADKNEVKQNEPVQFTNMSMDAQSYVWNFGDGGESNEKDPKYYYQKLYNFSNTYYTVKLRATSKYGCVNEVEKKDYILVKPAGTTGINENESTGARIYPNPIKNELVIESTNGVIERVEMYNTRGELAKIIKVQSEKHVVDMSNEAPGIYLVRIIGKEVMSIKMIVKQ